MMASNMNTTTSHNGGLQANDEINDLYEAIYSNPDYLDDSKLILETPLHIAASAGKVHVATEIMRLKPSLAWKLNPQGQSPIHLAMQHEKYEMVLRFVEINKKLVRVKAKGGLTPLHLASQQGNVELLGYFLKASPDSIEDVTVKSETALNIAIIHNQFDAFKFLVEWLKKNVLRRAKELEEAVLYWKDETGNTVLHTLAIKNNLEMIQFVIKKGMYLNVMNLDNKTALDLARDSARGNNNAQDVEIAQQGESDEISRILIQAGAISGEQVMISGGTSMLSVVLLISSKGRMMKTMKMMTNPPR